MIVEAHAEDGRVHSRVDSPLVVVREVSDTAEFPAVAESWRRLADTQPEAELFGTWEWAGSSLEAFSSPGSLAAFFVFQGDSLAGVFPLLRQNVPGLCASVFAFPGEQSSFLSVPGMAPLEALRRHLGHALSHWSVSLPGCRREYPTLRELRGYAGASDMSCWERPDLPTRVIDLADGWEAYLASRDSHVRHEWRRKRRKLERAGRLELATFTEPGDCDRALEAFFAIETRSWKEGAQTSLAGEGQRQFHTLLARRAAERGWLRLHVLYLDGRPIAHLYGVLFKNQLHAVATSYDVEHAALSPGLAVVLHAIEAAAREGVARIDLLGSKQRWKTEVGTGVLDRVTVCLHPRRSWRCTACHLLEDKAKPALKRRFPALLSWKREVQARWRGHRRGSPVPGSERLADPRLAGTDPRGRGESAP